MKENIIKNKAFAFAKALVKEIRILQDQQKEYVMSKQLLKSGTAIGALVREAEYAESRADFLHKMTISLKEASETEFWLDLMSDAGYVNASTHANLKIKIEEIIKLLIAITKTAKQNLSKMK